MAIFTFCLGLLIGFLLKLGFDEYHYFRDNQAKSTSKMEDVLAKFKAMEILENADRIFKEKKI